MRLASAVLLVVGALFLAPESAVADRSRAEDSYAVETPAPEGRTICLFDIVVDKQAGDTGWLNVEIDAVEGEARIAEWGIGSGNQDGCDIFPDGPWKTEIPLATAGSVFVFPVTLQVHAHPPLAIPNNCTKSGHADGDVYVSASASPGLVRVSMSPIVCRAQ